MRIETAMLMAAGLGTRLRPFTDFFPKALTPLFGVPISQFSIDSLVGAGVKRIVANVHHQAQAAEIGLKNLELGGASLSISDEREKLLGSAGGIRKALPLLGSEPFFLVNADVLSSVDFHALARQHERNRARFNALITLMVLPRAPESGIEGYREIISTDDQIKALGEKRRDAPFFASSAVIEPEAVAHLAMNEVLEFVPKILQPAIDQGRAGVFRSEGIWHDLSDPALWLETHLDLIERLEIGNLPTAWRKRIEKLNTRVASGIWASKNSRITTDWAAPCYWGNLNHEPSPRVLGPNAVQYGRSRENELSSGIGFKETWVFLKTPKSF